MEITGEAGAFGTKKPGSEKQLLETETRSEKSKGQTRRKQELAYVSHMSK